MPAKLVTGGSVTVTAAGTAVPLSSSELEVRKLWVTALAGNTGNKVWVGDSSTDQATERGIPIAKGSTLELDFTQEGGTNNFLSLKDIYVDADTNGDGVDIVYIQRP